MSHEPVRDLRHTMARTIAKAKGLAFDQQQALAAGLASFVSPLLEGKPDAAMGLYWGAASESAKAWPSIVEMEQRIGTAYHEAGHVLCAVRSAVAFHYASLAIPPGVTCTGLVMLAEPVRFNVLEGNAGRIEAETWCSIELAGPLAQTIAGHPVEPRIQERHDRTAERHLLRYRPPLPLAPWLAFCRATTEALLRREWPAVDRIARALLREDTLTSSDVTALLES